MNRVQQLGTNLYDKFRQDQFRLVSSLICLMGDLAICRYLYLKMTSDEVLNIIFDRIQYIVSQSQPGQQLFLPEDFHAQVYQLLIQSLTIMFVAIISLHLITYALFITRQPKACFYYIKFMAWVGTPGFFLIGISSLSMTPIGPYLIFQSLLYLFIVVGFMNYADMKRKEVAKS